MHISDWISDVCSSDLGAQARRQAGIRLAVRLSLSAPEVRQHREALRLRLRSARARRAAVADRLRPGHRADAGQRHGAADVPARADWTRLLHGQSVSRVYLLSCRLIKQTIITFP